MKTAPCQICGSKKFKKDSGLLVCSNGHQSTSFREEMDDDDQTNFNVAKRGVQFKKDRLITMQDAADLNSQYKPCEFPSLSWIL